MVDIKPPEGFSVSVNTHDGRDFIAVYRDNQLTAGVGVLGTVTEVYPSEDGEKICAWCSCGMSRFFVSFDADQTSNAAKPTPYIPTHSKEPE